MLNRRAFIAAAVLIGAAAPAAADDWRATYPKLTMGVVTSENEADRIVRYKPVIAYLENTLGVPVEFRNATDYAGVIEALNADKLKKFLDNDRKVLRFFCVWDDRDALYGDRRPYVIHYYLRFVDPKNRQPQKRTP